MAVVWAQCDRRCGARRAVHRRRVIRGHAVLRNYSARYSPVRNRSASDSRQLRPDSFFRYCLGLRGGGSSHFAPICTAKLRRDQSSGGGGWDKCTECHINHGHRGLSPSLSLSLSLSLSVSLSLTHTHTHTHCWGWFSTATIPPHTVHKRAVKSKHTQMHLNQQQQPLNSDFPHCLMRFW